MRHGEWRIPRPKHATPGFSVGQLLLSDEAAEEELGYIIETEDGRLESLKPSEFEVRISKWPLRILNHMAQGVIEPTNAPLR